MMASGLDVAAGALGITSIAAQLAQSLWKVKTFYRHVKNAPNELLDTVESLEHFNVILYRLAQEPNQFCWTSRYSDVLEESLRICQNAVHRVEQVTAVMQPRLGRRKYQTAIKWVLGRKDMKNLLQTLTQSKLDLYFAYSLYTESCRKQDFLAVCQCLGHCASDQKLFTQTKDQDHNIEPSTKPGASAIVQRSQSTAWVASLRLPLWLTRRTWDIAFERAAGHWTMSFQSYQVIPWMSHPAERLCRTNDSHGLRGLLQQRQLCIHDEFEFHHVSILLYAAFHGATDVVKLLLDSGADASCLRNVMHFFPWINDEAHPASLQSIRLHAKFLHETLDGDSNPFLKAASKDPESWNLEDRLVILDRTLCLTSPQLFFEILGPVQINTGQPLTAYDAVQCGILHMIARQWAAQIVTEPNSAQTWQSRWFDLIKQYATSPDFLHDQDAYGDTPFMRFLQIVARTRISEALWMWTEALQSANIDLLSYGRTEMQHIQQHPDFRDILSDSYGFIIFSYGPQPKDWHIWFLHPGDSFAGSFWQSMQDPYISMPGSWPPDSDIDEFEMNAADNHYCSNGFETKLVRRRQALKADPGYEPTESADTVCYGCVKCNDEDVANRFNIRMHRNHMTAYMEQDCWRGATTEIFYTDWVPKFLDELSAFER